jgi:hypothetical protein
MAMRHSAPLFFLPTLFIITKVRIIQFSQHVKATLGLSVYSYHIPTVTKSGGMDGGMKLLMDAEFFSNKNQGF